LFLSFTKAAPQNNDKKEHSIYFIGMELSFQGVEEYFDILEGYQYQEQKELLLISHGIKKDKPGRFLTNKSGSL
jgi:hypothetical protein